MTNLEAVRAAVIAAVPEIKRCNVCSTNRYRSDCFLDHAGQETIRPITLADVLMAIGKRPNRNNHERTWFGDTAHLSGDILNIPFEPFEDIEGRLIWKLALSLDDQPQEVIDFLHSILVV